MVRRHRARLPPADVDRAIAKVLDTLDLSGLPPVERFDQGVERAVLLLEILGRIALPPLARVPDAAAVEASGLTQWTIPDTEITIARTEAGQDAGRFQFTWPTVQQLPAFYEGGADAELAETLARDLTAVASGPLLYEEKRFDRIDVGPETQDLLERAPEGDDLQRLNWLLLHDAYPSELSRRRVMRA